MINMSNTCTKMILLGCKENLGFMFEPAKWI